MAVRRTNKRPDPTRNRTSLLEPPVDNAEPIAEASGIELEEGDEDPDGEEIYEPLPPAVQPKGRKGGLSPKNRYQARRMVKLGVDQFHFAGSIFELKDTKIAAELLAKGSIRAA